MSPSPDYAEILYCSDEIIRRAAPPALHSVGLLNVPYSTFAGADPQTRVPSRVAQRT